MSGKKGMIWYSEEIKEKIRKERQEGASIKGLNRKYGISRWAIHMLLITNDGRKLALDQRLLNDMLPDDEDGKVATCARNVFKIWEDSKSDRLAQLVFCDLSTPKNDGKFNV